MIAMVPPARATSQGGEELVNSSNCCRDKSGYRGDRDSVKREGKAPQE